MKWYLKYSYTRPSLRRLRRKVLKDIYTVTTNLYYCLLINSLLHSLQKIFEKKVSCVVQHI